MFWRDLCWAPTHNVSKMQGGVAAGMIEDQIHSDPKRNNQGAA